jgi:multicomponent Na+:H+ antiporter subunit D
MTLPFPILIIVVPLISAFLIIVIGWWKKSLCYPLMLVALVVSALSAVAILIHVMAHGTLHYYLGGWDPPWGIEYVIDPLNALVAVIVSGISFLIGISSKQLVNKEFPEKVVYFNCIFLLQVTGLLGIVVTGDVFNLYVFLEIASLAGYALIAIGEDGAPFASFNYMIYGTIGACFYLLSVGYLYIATGSLNMADLSKLLPDLYHSKVVLMAFAFFAVGVAIKMALFPLHVWLPDAYTYAPSSVSSLVAPLTTKVGAYVLIRIMYAVFTPEFALNTIPAGTILCWVATAAILFGCILALAQSDLKRMFSYVLIAEVGYIALGVGLGNRQALTGAILHILNDSLMMASLFLIVGALGYKDGPRKIDGLRGVHRKMPLTMASLVITAFSVIGLPPTCGFFSKWYLVLGAIEAKEWLFAAVLLVSSLLNAILFIRVIEKAYFEPVLNDSHEGMPKKREIDEAPFTILGPLLLLTAGILSVGVLSGKIISGVIRFAIPAAF